MNFVFHIFVSVSVDNFSLRKSATSQTCKTLAASINRHSSINNQTTI